MPSQACAQTQKTMFLRAQQSLATERQASIMHEKKEF
jgi:hypothetical protein